MLFLPPRHCTGPASHLPLPLPAAKEKSREITAGPITSPRATPYPPYPTPPYLPPSSPPAKKNHLSLSRPLSPVFTTPSPKFTVSTMEEVLLRHARLPRPTAPTARRSRRLRVVAVALRTRPTSLAVRVSPPRPRRRRARAAAVAVRGRRPRRGAARRGVPPADLRRAAGCAPSCCPCPWGPSRRRCGS